jgi:hypothetical protein
MNPLTYLTYVLSNVSNKQITLLTPDQVNTGDLELMG